jgi:GNAT superfamily N-acetyltransferase
VEARLSSVRELAAGETALAYTAMRELRTHLASEDEFVRQVDRQRAHGYRLIGVFVPSVEDAVAVAGFWTSECLSAGRYLYVDDLVTQAEHRNRGHAAALLDWLTEAARRDGCVVVRLDSATHRHGAHGFYFDQGMRIASFHFVRAVDAGG